jgi:hypothetical protein
MLDINGYREVVDSFGKQLFETDDAIATIKLAEDKWSLKEIIGHLIDSASNNHQRFVRLQSGDLQDFPPYDAEVWIKVQKYNGMDWGLLVSLWYNLNFLLLNIIENTDEKAYGNVWIRNGDGISFMQLVPDYFKHMELHIGHFKNRLNEVHG